MAGTEELDDLTTTGTSGAPDESTDVPDDTTAEDEVEFAQAPVDDDELPPARDPDAEPEAPVPPEGVTVDDKGRWRTPDGKFASKQPTPEAAESAKAEEAAAAQAAAAPPPPDPVVPWKANVYGNETDLIPGAKFHPEHGVLIPLDQIGKAQMLMARGTKYEEVRQARQQFAQERETIVGAARFENESLANVLQQTALNPEWVMLAATDPESANRQMQFMLKEAQLNLKEKYGSSPLATPAKPEPPKTQDPGDLDPYDAEMGVREWLRDDVLSQPEYHGLFSPAEQDAIVRRLMTVEPFAKHEGRWALDTLVAQQFVDALAEAPRREQALRAQQEKDKVAHAAAKRNDAAVPKPTTPPASKPVAKAKGAKAPADYTDKPWLNPALSKEEKRELLRESVMGKSK